MRMISLLAFLVACGGSSSDSTIAKIDGTATVGGKPAKLTGCKVVKDKDGQPALEVTLDTGLVFTDDSYDGSSIRTHDGKAVPSPLDCTRNSGNESGGSDWLTGTMGITCSSPDGDLVIDATYDCGNTHRPSNRKD